jgi:acetyltransferase-like isoleucine patch superfamily enzyme
MSPLKNVKMQNPFSHDFDISGWFFFLIYVFRIKANLFLFNKIIQLSCKIKGVKLGKNIKFNGYPIIRRAPNSQISISDNCKLNSSKKSVIIHLKNRCVLATVKEGAQISIGKNSGVTGVTMVANNKIEIGENVLIGVGCTIIDNDFHNSDPTLRNKYAISKNPVIVEDNVFIGMNCVILKGVTIGKNSVIGANSVVMSDIPPNSFAMGNPCRLIIKRNWGESGNS